MVMVLCFTFGKGDGCLFAVFLIVVGLFSGRTTVCLFFLVTLQKLGGDHRAESTIRIHDVTKEERGWCWR